MGRRRTPVWTPSADQTRHWSAVSGNAINGVESAAPSLADLLARDEEADALTISRASAARARRYSRAATCPCRGPVKLSKLGEGISETLEVVPRQWKVIQTIRERSHAANARRSRSRLRRSM